MDKELKKFIKKHGEHIKLGEGDDAAYIFKNGAEIHLRLGIFAPPPKEPDTLKANVQAYREEEYKQRTGQRLPHNPKLREFYLMNGSYIKVGGWLYFETGAKLELTHFGMAKNPPQDPYARSKAVRDYWKAKLDLQIEEFTNEKRRFAHRALIGPENIDHMKKLKEKVDATKQKLSQAERELEEATPAQWKQRKQVEFERQQQTDKLRQKLNSITI